MSEITQRFKEINLMNAQLHNNFPESERKVDSGKESSSDSGNQTEIIENYMENGALPKECTEEGVQKNTKNCKVYFYS